jgi:SAM-dependent methyltransferase
MSDDRTATADRTLLASQLLETITGSWKAQAVHVAAELRLADLLANGPRTSAELAAATGAHAPSLQRLLRALTALDVCRECDDGAFEIAPLGSLLGTDDPDSLRSWAIWWGAHLWPVWGNLLYSVRTGQSARALLTGTDGFKHLERDPEAAAIFNQALVELTRLACAHIVRAYDFTGLRRIVDVGGGYGELLAAILKAQPAAFGVLFDLPHALDGARQRFEKAGLAERCEFVAGDFFASVPDGADAYVLKSVIHDWNDERSRQILASCRRAMGVDARLLLVEQVLPERLEVSATHQALARSDLNMLVAHAAGERTAAELGKLLHATGFTVTRIVPAGPTWSVIEAFARR